MLLASLLMVAAMLSPQPAGAARSQPDDSERPTRIEVYPPQIKLASKRSRVQLVVTGYFAAGEVRDLTRAARYRAAEPNVANMADAVVSGQSNGRTTIEVHVGDRTASVPVVVSGMDRPDPVRFEAETLAVLTKQGCNAGSCHGSPNGKGGFALSMAAYNPAIDRESLILGGLTRRVQVIEPEESLLLKKPMLRVTHVGGKKLRKSDAAYPILRDWIFEGAKPDVDHAPRPVKIVVHPTAGRLMRFPHVEQQLSVLAHFSDDTIRDVTAIATFDSTHKSVATVNANGLVTGSERGQAAITVRYLEHVQCVHFTVVQDVSGFAWTTPPETNYVDRLVNQKLRQLQYLPSDICDDSVFLRRVCLDLTGLLPSTGDAKAFLADRAADKRARKIDELLASAEFARFWALKTADLMRVSETSLKAERAELFSRWIAEAFQNNMPFDEFAKAILMASGDTHAVAPANYFEAVPKNQDLTETTAQIFMGSRINCAKCHNHPFENWTQNDYYRIGAVFSRVKIDGDMITLEDSGEMRHPTSGEVMQPWGAESSSRGSPPADRRQWFVDWLTKRGNPFFARVEVNRIWSQLLGRGIVEPVDDFRSSNPPANAPLLDALAKDFEDHGYDRKAIIRTICNSNAYQRSTETNSFNADDDTLFSHYRVRRLSAEQLSDAIGYVTQALPRSERVELELAEQQAALEKRLSDLSGEYAVWEADAAKRVAAMPFWTGLWYSVGPFPVKKASLGHQTAFAPEEAVDLAASYGDGRAWQAHPEWKDGYYIKVPFEAQVGTCYLTRTIHSHRDETAVVDLERLAPLKIWFNGKLLCEHENRTPKSLQLELPLKQGENRLLIKATDSANNRSQILFKSRTYGGKVAAKPEFPHFVMEYVARAAEPRSPGEQEALQSYHRDFDPRVVQSRVRINRLSLRLDYATQRSFPEQSDFLRAFGQPKRESACACERLSEPTVDQALQLLNGQRVISQMATAVNRYGKQAAKIDTFLDELYLAALARYPSDNERATATAYCDKTADRKEAVRDLVWAIVNTQEFLFQH
jgi:hypothetical protein